MNKSESKYYNTACLMDKALLFLLEKKDYDRITVKEIFEEAGVNRSTFYLHYETIDDLLEESLSFVFSGLEAKYKLIDIDVTRPESEVFLITSRYITPYLEFLKENKRLFLTALSNPALFKVGRAFDDIYRKIYEPVLERFGVEERERKYILAFFVQGIHAIAIEWVRSGCEDDVEFISGLMMKYTGRFRTGDEEVTPRQR